MVQPGIGCTATEAMGDFVGSSTCTPTVLAVADSLGTEKLRISELPCAAVAGRTVTWASTGAAASSTPPTASAAVVPTRVVHRLRDLVIVLLSGVVRGVVRRPGEVPDRRRRQ